MGIRNIIDERGFVAEYVASDDVLFQLPHFVNVNEDHKLIPVIDPKTGYVETIPMHFASGSAISTGILSGGLLSINADTTKFNISAGEGDIIDYCSNPMNPQYTHVTWGNKTGILDSYIASTDNTSIAIDAKGDVIQSPTYFTFEQRREYIILGRTVHPNRASIVSTQPTPTQGFDQVLAVEDFIRGVGPIALDGIMYMPDGANLQFNRTSGTLYRVGINYGNSAAQRKNPNSVIVPAASNLNFQYEYRDGHGDFIRTANTQNIVPNKYDTGTGTLVDVHPAGYYTIQRIFYFPSGITVVVYGQTQYKDLASALSALQTEQPILNPALTEACFRAWLIMPGTVRNLNDSSVRFMHAGKFGDTTACAAGAQGAQGETGPAFSYVTGSNLTNVALQTLSIVSGSEYTLPAATLSQNTTIKLSDEGSIAPFNCELLVINNVDVSSYTKTVQDISGSTLLVVSTQKCKMQFRYDQSSALYKLFTVGRVP